MKTDRKLGNQVKKYLLEKGVETPIVESELNIDEKIELIEENMEVVIDVLGLDREDDSISGTANRVAKMYVSELCSGLSYDQFPKVSVFENKMGYDQMVVQKDITFHSMCEHHFVNFNGMAQVAYIPNDTVVGLSKLNRIQVESLLQTAKKAGVFFGSNYPLLKCDDVDCVVDFFKTDELGWPINIFTDFRVNANAVEKVAIIIRGSLV